MKSFHCTYCQNLVFFENSRCLSCLYTLIALGLPLVRQEAPNDNGLVFEFVLTPPVIGKLRFVHDTVYEGL